MDNIKSYELFINESFATVNENIFSNIKDKIINKWNSLDVNQKVELSDKVNNIIDNASTAARFGLLFYILVQLVDVFLLPNFKLSNYLIWIINGMYWLIILTQMKGGKRLRDLRIQTIQAKVRELRNEFNENWLNYMFIILGEKQNVQACLERLIEDGILTKDLIHKTHDGNILIDMTGKFEKKPVITISSTHSDIDPYGEETWNEDEEKQSKNNRDDRRADLYGYYRTQVITSVERLFNVKFRSLYDLESFTDLGDIRPKNAFGFKKRKRPIVDDTRYKVLVKDLKPRLKQIEKAE